MSPTTARRRRRRAGVAAPRQRPHQAGRRQPGIAPQKEQEAADFASRLMRAKKKVWEERDKDKDKQ